MAVKRIVTVNKSPSLNMSKHEMEVSKRIFEAALRRALERIHDECKRDKKMKDIRPSI